MEAEARLPFSDPRKRSEVRALQTRGTFEELRAAPPKPVPVTYTLTGLGIPRQRRERLVVGHLQSDEAMVERIRDFLPNEPWDDEEDVREKPHFGSLFATPREDDIAARLSAFRKRTESLLSDSRRKAASMRNRAGGN
jgi:hypothetical protein